MVIGIMSAFRIVVSAEVMMLGRVLFMTTSMSVFVCGAAMVRPKRMYSVFASGKGGLCVQGWRRVTSLALVSAAFQQCFVVWVGYVKRGRE